MGDYDRCFKHKRNNPACDPWDSQRNEKNAIPISIAFSAEILIGNENVISVEHSVEHKTKYRLK